MLEIDKIYQGDCLELMPLIPDKSIDAIVTDPPYELAFMGKKWDASGIAYNVDMWGECLRVLKPGGHLLAFGGSRTYHRMACAIENAGFEIRDSIHWVYGCLSDDTEILIDGAWSHYHKANIGDLTICYNNETNSYSWQPIQEIFEYRIKDTAYRIQSDLTDQIITRGHRCLIERKGKLLFCFAEEAAQEREIHVPVLEDLQGLLKALQVPYTRAGSQKNDMHTGLCKDTIGAGESRAAKEGRHRTDLPGLRQDVSDLERMGKEEQNKLLLKALQRCPSRRGVEEARAQRPRCMVRRDQEELCFEDNRAGKFCMERRRDLLQNSRELYGREICPMPSEISINGPERRLCNGTPLDSCSENKAMPEEIRGCAPYQPRPNRQPLRESSAIQNQPGPQEIRGAGLTRTTLARIEPIEYDGIVWCVRVPTGAFVARRNGKIFVTGNSGFPKSLDISKQLDKMAGAERKVISVAKRSNAKGSITNYSKWERPEEYDITAPTTEAAKQWAGFGSTLKPAHEPVVLARKPLDGCTIAENVLRWGCGGLNIDGCRILTTDNRSRDNSKCDPDQFWNGKKRINQVIDNSGRFPSNLIHDGSPEVLQLFPQSSITGKRTAQSRSAKVQATAWLTDNHESQEYTDSGSASRFFMACEFTPADYAPIVYYAKASKSDRGEGNTHNTVKPTSLIQYLCKLITPPGGTILDPFGGSGTTGIAAIKEGFHYILIEKEPEYCEIARKRIAATPMRLDNWM